MYDSHNKKGTCLINILFDFSNISDTSLVKNTDMEPVDIQWPAILTCDNPIQRAKGARQRAPDNHMWGDMSILYTVKVPNSLIKVIHESTRQMRQTEQRGKEEE